MVAAIRQTVTVQPDGRIEIRSPQLQPGTQAEVIVLVEDSPRVQSNQSIEALDALQKSLKLNTATAEAWIATAKAERAASFGGET